jgi:hypothetical protein
MAICLVFSCLYGKAEKNLKIFPVLLFFSLFTEILSLFFVFHKVEYLFLYHLYVPIEYSLWAYYFYLAINKKLIKKIIISTIPLFIIFSFTISCIIGFKKFSTLQINMEGLLLITWAVICIFSIEINKGTEISIFLRPVFWICVAVLIYYSSTFSFTSIYNFIFESKKELLTVLRLYFLIVPNCIFYTCLSIAFICSQVIKK